MNSESQNLHSDKCLCTYKNINLPGGRRVGRRLVVAFDGTENQFGPQSSHVVEFYSRIERNGDQQAYYTSGIGTFVQSSSILRRPRISFKNKWASMTGRHFKSNLLSGYRFLSDKYEKGDQIFLLGFSRGAYQARVLAAMITRVGLLRSGNNEQIPFAFKTYLDPKASKEKEIDRAHPDRRRGQTTVAKEFKKAFCHDVNIHFVGVWDTVSSVGLCRNKYYPGADQAENICFFRHALALDERRVKFIPEYIVAKEDWFSAGEFGRPRCKEVWFRGSHSDIGGGNVENPTSDNGAIPSRWMAYEAMLAGLDMAPFWDGFRVKDLEPSTGKDSMRWFYKPLEYFPFSWEVHFEDNPPLLTSGGPPRRRFSRAFHGNRPRQIFKHQKLHLSVCLHRENFPENPYAYLPKSWINTSRKSYSWTEVKNLLRDKGEDIKGQADEAYSSGASDLPRSEFSLILGPSSPPSTIITEDNESFRDAVSRAGSISSSLSMQSFPAVQNDPPVIRPKEVITEPTDEPGHPDLTDAASILPEFTLPAGAIELDLLAYDAIPALIAGVLKGANVAEFLDRLGVLAYPKIGKTIIRENVGHQFSSMIRQIFDDKKHVKYIVLAIRVAYGAFWHSDVDLYDKNPELWKAIYSRVENWDELDWGELSLVSKPCIPALRRAIRLLYKTETKNALVEIGCMLTRMFNKWQQSSLKFEPPPSQLRSLLETGMSRGAQDYILPLAVLSSPLFRDPVFTKSLLNRLISTIQTDGGRMKKLAMVCFFVLCVTDDGVKSHKTLFRPLKQKFVELGPPMTTIWALVVPEIPHKKTVYRFGQYGDKITELKNLLQKVPTEILEINDCSWAREVLDKALGLQEKLSSPIPSPPDQLDQNTGRMDGMPSVGERGSTSGQQDGMTASGPIGGVWPNGNMLDDPIPGRLSPPALWEADEPPRSPSRYSFWCVEDQLSSPTSSVASSLATSLPVEPIAGPSQNPEPVDEGTVLV